MDSIHRKLLTIVTESLLETSIIEALDDLGVSGYTIVNARGRGSRGVRDAGWESSGNIRVEVVCDATMAERIAESFRNKFYANYAMILYIGDVTVLRSDKF
jgi:nitrogen regulatory protein PII